MYDTQLNERTSGCSSYDKVEKLIKTKNKEKLKKVISVTKNNKECNIEVPKKNIEFDWLEIETFIQNVILLFLLTVKI